MPRIGDRKEKLVDEGVDGMRGFCEVLLDIDRCQPPENGGRDFKQVADKHRFGVGGGFALKHEAYAYKGEHQADHPDSIESLSQEEMGADSDNERGKRPTRTAARPASV